MKRMPKSSRECAAALICLLLAGCSHSAAVAVHPITSRVYYAFDDMLHSCDSAAKGCQDHKLAFKPVDAAFSDAGMVFISSDALYRCDKDGQNCSTPIRLQLADDAVGVYCGQGGQVVVVSSGGDLNTCDATKCEKPPK